MSYLGNMKKINIKMKNLKKVFGLLFLLVILLPSFNVKAQEVPVEPETEIEIETATIHLTMRAGEVFFSEDIEILEDSTVLSVLETADESSDLFSLSDVQVYPFGSYLKCIDIQDIGEKCDDWQYILDNDYPSTSIDTTSVSGHGSIYLYFSAKNRISLDNDSITTEDSVTATVEKYEYEDGVWEIEDDATIGVTEPDTTGAFNPPIEIMTGEVDENGQIVFSSIPAGVYDVGIRDEYGYYFPTQILTVTEASSPSSGSSSGNSSPNTKKKEGKVLGVSTNIKFDIQKAFNFLYTQQKEDGSFGEDIYTDWASITLATDESHKSETIRLIKYLNENNISGTPLLTDYERHAMALMSLGLNPYNTNGENYIKKIIDAFDGKQFGDINEDNDDIFALIVLQNAGYTIEDIEIINALKFILERQKENGSWDESIDMTGASMSALAKFSDRDDVKNALSKGKEFLKSKQEKDGGFENVSSTAWAIEGIVALGEKPEDWVKKENTPNNFFAVNQDTDGGIKNEDLNNKLWQTTYVLKALSGKTWNQVMQNFEKKEIAIARIIEKPKVVPIVKKTIVKIPEDKTPMENLEEIVVQNTAEVINAIEETEQKKTGFFARVFKNIFGIFN